MYILEPVSLALTVPLRSQEMCGVLTYDAGRVCVPVDPALVDDFDPDTVPTVGDLLNELDNLPADSDDVAKARRVEGESTIH